MRTSLAARSLLVTCLLAASSAGIHAEPLKVAMVETFSGPQTSTGLAFRSGTRYAIDRINAQGGWNGEPIQLLEYDNLGTTSGAADKFKAAVAAGAQIIVQSGSSSIAGQLTEDVRRYNMRNPGKEILYVNLGAEALELTGEKCHFHHVRFGTNAQIRVKALVGAMKPLGVLGTRVYAINQNYSWGQDMQRTIEEYAAAGGYQVVEKTLHDVNKIQDFAPYVSKISATRADTVITGNWSNDLLLLMKAVKAAGMKTRFATSFLDQPGNIANAGDTALGHFVAHPFNAEAGGAESERFVAEYKAKTGRVPTFVEPQSVFAFEFIGAALRSTKPDGGRLNVNAFIKNMEATRYRTPMGELSLRAADHQALLPMVVSTVALDARYKADETAMGFKPVKLFSAAEAAAPVQAGCRMQRPD